MLLRGGSAVCNFFRSAVCNFFRSAVFFFSVGAGGSVVSALYVCMYVAVCIFFGRWFVVGGLYACWFVFFRSAVWSFWFLRLDACC
jgi:hypothetical protein